MAKYTIKILSIEKGVLIKIGFTVISQRNAMKMKIYCILLKIIIYYGEAIKYIFFEYQDKNP
jgi:hypothetical protein